MKKRETYPEYEKCDLKTLYKSDAEFMKDWENLQNKITQFSFYKGHILDTSKNLISLLNLDDEFSQTLEKLIIYAHLKNDQDTSNPTYQKMYGKVSKLYEEYHEATAYIVPEILKGNYEDITKFYEEVPDLKKYDRVLKEIFKFKKHTLSDKEEQVISVLQTTFSLPDDVFGLLSDADMRFGLVTNEAGQREELSEKSYHKLISSDNRLVRRHAFKKLYQTYSNFKNTYAALLNGEVKKNNKIALLRGYNSALEASLFANDIKPEIYTNLINCVKKNIDPLSKYWQVKKKALHVSKLHLYDTYAPITSKIKKEYTFLEAKDLIMASLSVLGSKYTSDLNKAFLEKWIDYCPNECKRNGAYCTACYNTHPYVLLSFDGTLNSVSTLIHELGHAMHYYYAIKNQSYQDYSYSIFVAEVASQVNQILLSKYLINKTNDTLEKAYLIDDLIQDFKATIYRQSMFAEFEKTIHELDQKGEILTYDVLNNLYYDLNKTYNGQNIVIDDEIKYEWLRIPHFYMNFYVYQYATAYAAAIKIAMDILNHKEGSVENYLKFLSLGATLSPIESLKVAGVNMESEEVLKEAFTYFNDLVNQLKVLKDGEENE